VSCAYARRSGSLAPYTGTCTEPAVWVVYFTDPLTGMWPAARCHAHALGALLGQEPPYRVVAIDPVSPFRPIRTPF
jgi:hypothetical protein